MRKIEFRPSMAFLGMIGITILIVAGVVGGRLTFSVLHYIFRSISISVDQSMAIGIFLALLGYVLGIVIYNQNIKLQKIYFLSATIENIQRSFFIRSIVLYFVTGLLFGMGWVGTIIALMRML